MSFDFKRLKKTNLNYQFDYQHISIKNISDFTPNICFIQLVFIALQSLNTKDMIFKMNKFIIALCRWRYWKQPQRNFCSVGHRNKGFFVLLLNTKDYDYES